MKRRKTCKLITQGKWQNVVYIRNIVVFYRGLFYEIPNLKQTISYFKNDGIVGRISRLLLEYFDYIFKQLIFHTINKKIIIIFDQFLLIPPFLKWEFGRTLENPSRIPLCLEYCSGRPILERFILFYEIPKISKFLF